MFRMFVQVVLATMAVIVVAQKDGEREGKGVMFGWNIMEGARRSCIGIKGRPGVCMGQNECTELNGKSVGRCFPFESCCSITPNSCGGYSDLSTSYFQNPDKFQEMCAYKINVRRNVCQIRIDFERFSLGQPTKPNNESAYVCERDEFTLFSNDNTKMTLPVLCGENSGQHVYVPINQHASSDSNNRQQLTLKFRLTNRDEDYNDPEPHWKLKITQLECQTTSTNWWKIKDIARQVWEWEEEERDTTNIKYSLAPDGCLQYFTDKDGSFESFNYNKGLGHYLGSLNYAVCFKRNQDTCGIKYDAVKFQLAYNQDASNATDRDCDTAVATGDPSGQTTVVPSQTSSNSTNSTSSTTASNPENQSTIPANEPRDYARRRRWPVNVFGVHNDYLLVPDGLYSERFFASKYCYRSLERFDDIAVFTRGPLYVAFVSDEYSNPNEDVEKGFKINYSIINTGC